MKNNSIHFLLIHQSLATGGVETLMVRMSNWLVAHGHRVTLLLKEGGELTGLLSNRVELVIQKERHLLSFLPFWGPRYFRNTLTNKVDVLYSFGPKSCYYAGVLYKYHFERSVDSPPVFLTGMYHPSQLMSKSCTRIENRFYANMYINYVADSSKMFMSEQVRACNEALVRRQFLHSTIWPLPIDGASYMDIKRRPEEFRIVSIGNLKPFKTYNLYMIDVVRELVEEGWNVTWDVYGYGLLKSVMKEKIEQAGLQHRIQLKGKLAYTDIKSVLETAYAFVGMGTSLIEAGFCRVPSIPALVDDMDGVSYGYLFDLPYYACGEKIEKGVKEVKVIDLLRDLFQLSSEEYRLYEERTFKYVQAYSMDTLMNRFIDIADKAPRKQRISEYPSWRFVIYFPYRIYRECRSLLSPLKSRLCKTRNQKKAAVLADKLTTRT